jgi:hypothetical protein
VPEHVRTRLRELLLASGAIQKDRRTRERVERQRRLHKVSVLHRQGQDPETIATETSLTVEQVAAVLQPADHAPTVKEMREWRATYNPNGEVGDLKRRAPEWDTFDSLDEGQQPITSPDEGVVSLSKHRSSKKVGVA